MSSNPQSLVVYRGWLLPGKYVWSPYVTKLEARLRFAGIPYVSKSGSPKQGPKGKIPYVELSESAPVGEDSARVTSLSDSTLIIKELVERDILPVINGRLPPTARAQDLAIRALMEDKLSFYHMRERWIDNYYTMRDHILSVLPYPVRVVVGLLIYRGTTQTLYGQGTGRYTADEMELLRREIWESINDLLVASQSSSPDNGPFWIFAGDGPTEVDCTVFGFIVSVLVSTAGPGSQSLVKQFPVVLDYAERIHDRYFPDYMKWTEPNAY